MDLISQQSTKQLIRKKEKKKGESLSHLPGILARPKRKNSEFSDGKTFGKQYAESFLKKKNKKW